MSDAPAPPPAHRAAASRRATRATLAAVLLAAAALRLAGNSYGLPQAYAPDEVAKVETARALVASDFAHPPAQPSFLYYSLFVIAQAADLLGPALRTHGWVDAARFPAGHPALAIWLGRCYLALLGALTAWVVYRLARELAGRAAGVLAAAVYALAPLPIAAAQYLKEDTPLALFAAAALHLAARSVRTGRRGHLLRAAGAAGVAAAAKYPGAGAVLPVFAAAWLASPGASSRWRRTAAAAPAVLGVAALAFALVCPVLATRPLALLGGVGGQVRYLERGHHDGIAVSGRAHAFTFYLRRALGPGVGVPALAAAAGAVLWRHRRAQLALVAAWAVGYTAFAESMAAKPYPFYARYVLPAVPALAALAGVMLARLAALARERTARPAWRAAAAAALACALVPAAVRATAYAATALPDTRDRARAWALEHVPPGAVLWVSPYAPAIGPAPFEVRALDPARVTAALAAEPERQQWVMLVSFYYERYVENPRSRPELARQLGAALARRAAGATFANRWAACGYANPVVHVIPVSGRAPAAAAPVAARSPAPPGTSPARRSTGGRARG